MSNKIAIIVGSLRKGSLNRIMANTLIALAPASLKLEIIEIGDLPLYNEDLDQDNIPTAWTKFREQMKECAGVLFITPEYNRSIPGALKNAIDVGSRPYGHSIWNDKPCAIMSLSPGAVGGFGANHHLRQALVFLNMPVLQQPEAYIGQAGKLFDEQGKLSNADTRQFLQNFMNTYERWFLKNTAK